MSAVEIRTLRNLASKLVKIEERDKLMGILEKSGVGLRDVEEFVMSEENKLKNKMNKSNSMRANNKKKRDIVTKIMNSKMRDNRREGVKIRKARNHMRRKIEETLGQNSRQCRGIMRSIKDNCMRLRTILRKKNLKKKQNS